MERWAGKVAVVTGASAGIGADIVQALSKEGITVVALARRKDKLQEVADSCEGKVYPKECDLSKEEDIINTFDWVESTLGGVDILVNNAGVIFPASLIGGNAADWKSMLDTNIMALSIATREAIKTMRKRGDSGHIVHINSISGHYVPKFYNVPVGMYAATKHAVTALTEALRVELQGLNSDIKITSISPGSVYTDMVRNYHSQLTGKLVIKGDLPPAHLEAKDVTDAVLYTLSTRANVQVHELIIQAIGQKYSQ